MKPANNFFRDIVTGIFVTTGLFGFISGEFVLSTMMFGAASLSSNLALRDDIRA